MRSQIETSQKIKVIAMGVLSIIMIILAIILFIDNDSTETNKSNNTKTTKITSTTPKKDDTNYVEAISVDNNDYFESACGVQYYIPELIVYEDALYAGIDENNELTKALETIKINNRLGHKILDNVKNAYFVENGECGYHYAFASGNDGKFYYINNYQKSKSEMLKVTLVAELSNIKTVESRDDNGSIGAYAIDEEGKEYPLSEIIKKYAELEEEA